MEVISETLTSALDAAALLTKVRVYPYLEFAHATLCILHLREDILHTGGSVNFGRLYPLVTWLTAMLTTFAGVFLVALCCGEPLLGVFGNTDSVLLASLVWYLIFYSPGDIFISVIEFFPVKIILVLLKEIFRAKKIVLGVGHALHVFPGSHVAAILIAVLKANGSSFTLPLERRLRGAAVTGISEFMKPSVMTKAVILGSVLHVLSSTEVISVSQDIISVFVIAMLIYLHAGSLFVNVGDPFVPVENLVCSLTLGGAWEALKMAATANAAIEEKKEK